MKSSAVRIFALAVLSCATFGVTTASAQQNLPKPYAADPSIKMTRQEKKALIKRNEELSVQIQRMSLAGKAPNNVKFIINKLSDLRSATAMETMAMIDVRTRLEALTSLLVDGVLSGVEARKWVDATVTPDPNSPKRK